MGLGWTFSQGRFCGAERCEVWSLIPSFSLSVGDAAGKRRAFDMVDTLVTYMAAFLPLILILHVQTSWRRRLIFVLQCGWQGQQMIRTNSNPALPIDQPGVWQRLFLVRNCANRVQSTTPHSSSHSDILPLKVSCFIFTTRGTSKTYP